MPRDAYRYARGEQVTSNTGQPVKLRTPFDFFMITDHSDAMGAITDIISGAPDVMADPDGKRFHEAFNQATNSPPSRPGMSAISISPRLRRRRCCPPNMPGRA